MSELSHLSVIEYRLSNERIRRDNAKGKEREWREHNIRMIEKERQNEVDFLAKKGIIIEDIEDNFMTVDEIFAELESA